MSLNKKLAEQYALGCEHGLRYMIDSVLFPILDRFKIRFGTTDPDLHDELLKIVEEISMGVLKGFGVHENDKTEETIKRIAEQ